MTIEEHSLMLYMFAQQQKLIICLVEAMKTNDLLRAGDLEAFHAIAFPSDTAQAIVERRVNEDYLRAGKTLGVQNLPEPLA